MNYSNQHKVACIGIGGGGVFYVAKFFVKLGVQVYGFDLQESERTKELQSLGVRITFANPTKALEPGTSLFVYSPGLPNPILQELERHNGNIPHQDVGAFTTKLIHDYEENLLNEQEKTAFLASDIAPLFSLNQSKMTYIAVTGTDSKTTTCAMIYHILRKLGYKPGLISTVSAKVGDKDIDTGFHTTTPSSQELFKLLKLMEKEHCTHAIVEATSHGLAMGRLAGLKFNAIAYTNITSEHIDYHKTWTHYYLAKETLLTEHTTSRSIVVLNKDDKRAFPLLEQKAKALARDIISYSLTPKTLAMVTATDITENPTISFVINKQSQTIIPILGRYNISNALAAITLISRLENKQVSETASLLGNFQTVTGRMQIIQSSPFTVIIDFAHTANALEEALRSTRKILPKSKKLIVVFGCAGKRDDSKREPMGSVAGEHADITILTAEDPRTEKLIAINDAIEVGWKITATSEKVLYRFDDDSQHANIRRQAIAKAISLAKKGDVILITGKAHEQSLCFDNIEYPWTDITETMKLLRTLKVS